MNLFFSIMGLIGGLLCCIGDVKQEVKDLVANTEKSLYNGLSVIKEGARIGVDMLFQK